MGLFFAPRPAYQFEDSPKQVKCRECKHWVDVDDAQKVSDNFSSTDYYCLMHKRPFNRVEYHWGDVPPQYFGEVEMSPDGTPVGYIKAPANNPSTKKRGRPKGSKNKAPKKK